MARVVRGQELKVEPKAKKPSPLKVAAISPKKKANQTSIAKTQTAKPLPPANHHGRIVPVASVRRAEVAEAAETVDAEAAEAAEAGIVGAVAAVDAAVHVAAAVIAARVAVVVVAAEEETAAIARSK